MATTISEPENVETKSPKLSNPFVLTVICVQVQKDGKDLWWPAVAMEKDGSPFQWKLRDGVWTSAEAGSLNNDLDVTACYFIYCDRSPASLHKSWATQVHLQRDAVMPFGQRFVSFRNRPMPKHLLSACLNARSHILARGTKMEKDMIGTSWMSDMLTPHRFSTKNELRNQSKIWKKVSKKTTELPLNAVVWTEVETKLWRPAVVVEKHHNSSTRAFYAIKHLGPPPRPGTVWQRLVYIDQVCILFAGMHWIKHPAGKHASNLLKACLEAELHISSHGTENEKEYLPSSFFKNLLQALVKKTKHRKKNKQRKSLSVKKHIEKSGEKSQDCDNGDIHSPSVPGSNLAVSFKATCEAKSKPKFPTVVSEPSSCASVIEVKPENPSGTFAPMPSNCPSVIEVKPEREGASGAPISPSCPSVIEVKSKREGATCAPISPSCSSVIEVKPEKEGATPSRTCDDSIAGMTGVNRSSFSYGDEVASSVLSCKQC